MSSGPVGDPERLRRLLGQAAARRLVQQLRRRFEQGGGVEGTLALRNPSDAERHALAGLLGRPPGRGAILRVRLQALEDVLQVAGAAPDLRAAVEILSGPICDRRAEQALRDEAWRGLFQKARNDVRPLGLTSWLQDLEGSGLLRRLAQQDVDRAGTLLEQALCVARALPGRGQSLSILAATTLGDAHALDPGRPLATLCKKIAALLARVAEGDDTPESDREIWASVGVLVGGALTSTVLLLNVPAEGDSGTARILHLLCESGQPGVLTLRQLVRDPPCWAGGERPVYLCENPAVVAHAAETLGAGCAPLICTAGQPGAAVGTLLHRLAQDGAELFYHGDFDWPGIRIGNTMVRRFAVRPWRFDVAAYRGADAAGTKPLAGVPVAACWDAGLMAEMLARNRQIEEEQVLDALTLDLDHARSTP